MYYPDTVLVEDTATAAMWVQFRQAVRRAVRDKPAEVTAADVKNLSQALNDRNLKDLVSEVTEKPSESDIAQAISIIRSELGLTEGIVDNVQVVWIALKAAYATGKLVFLGKISLSGLALAQAQAITVLLAVVAVLVNAAAVGALFKGLYWLLDLVVDTAYRRWKLVKIPIFQVPLSSELKQSGGVSMIQRLKEDEDYRFFIPVMSWDAYHVTKQPVEIQAKIPFEFHGFVSPRWFEDTFMWLTPSAGRLDDEERLVELKHVVDIQNLDGIPIYSEEFDVQI